MNQLVSVLIAFLVIPILTKKKVKLSYALLISTGVLSILSKLRLEVLGQAVTSVVTQSPSRNTVLTVMMVSIFGGVMKHYNILDEIIDTMILLIRDKKKILVIIPAMIGVLIIPGGALLSAPFIYDLGEEMKLSPPRRAAINLVFRHIVMFVLPYSTSLLLISATLPELNIFKLILLNLIFVAAVVILGYFFFLKDIEIAKSPPRENVKHNLLKLVVYTSPIYIAVIINILTGLSFYITLLGSIFIVYLLGNKNDFLKVAVRSLNWHTVLTVVAILIMKEIILNMEGLLGIFHNMFNMSSGSILSMIAIFLISSFFFGYITGNQTAALAIIIPIVSQLNITGRLLYGYTYFAFGASFLGYFFSPLHLCQAFTLEHMKVSTSELYKEYKFYAPTLLLVLIVSVFILRL